MKPKYINPKKMSDSQLNKRITFLMDKSGEAMTESLRLSAMAKSLLDIRDKRMEIIK